MAVGTKCDFVIYDEQYYGGMFESIVQNVDVFNAASGGAITLTARDIKGDFSAESFIKDLDMVSRRIPCNTDDVADTPMVQGEFVSVKLNRRIGPVAQTLDAWKKINEDPVVMSYILGQMAGERIVRDYVNTAITAAVAAINNIPGLVAPSPTSTLNHASLVGIYRPLGDQGSRIAAFLMHSKPYYDLVGNAISDDKVDIGNLTIYPASPATYNKPTVVTDSPALVAPGSPDKHYVLGLVSNAIQVTESEGQDVAFQLITGKENLVYRYQGEYAYNLGLKGFTWDTSAGGENPTDAALASGANWKQEATEIKNLAGTIMVVE